MLNSVLIVGSTSELWLESSYARAFADLGATVHRWDPRTALAEHSRGGKLGRLFSVFVHVEPWIRKANLELLRLADELRPDLILVIGTEGLRAGTLAQVRVRAPRSLVYCVYPDSPHNLDTDRIHCLPFFDRVATSSPAWIDAFERLGGKSVQWLPFAADPHLHSPAPVDSAKSELAHDVVFIGTWRPEREAMLEQLADLDLRIWGGKYWGNRCRPGSPLPKRWGRRSITGSEFAQVCGASRVLLNVMDPATWPGPNMRTFEQPACGAFSLVSRTPAVTELFTEDENIVCFDTVDEAREKVRYYLAHETERQRIAEASYRFVIEGGHTYVDRARSLAAWASEDASG